MKIPEIPAIMWFGMVVFTVGALTGYVGHAIGAIVVVAVLDWFKYLGLS